jgi:hypothetical protein
MGSGGKRWVALPQWGKKSCPAGAQLSFYILFMSLHLCSGSGAFCPSSKTPGADKGCRFCIGQWPERLASR